MNDRAIGALILIMSIAGIVGYGYLLFGTTWSLLVLEITGFIAVAGILGILAWIGWTLATTTAPESINNSTFESDTALTEENAAKVEESKTSK